MDLTPYIIGGLLLIVAMPWIFILLLGRERKKHDRMIHDFMVYGKSASAFEAEDMIERSRGRDMGMIQRTLAKKKQTGDTLSGDEPNMADDFRKEITDKYTQE